MNAKHNCQHRFTGKLLLLLWLPLWLFLPGLVKAQNINIPNSTGPMGLEVNTYTGNLFFSRTDFSIPARGFNLSITFHYNSFSFDVNAGYGKGWSFKHDVRCKPDTANGRIITWGDGREDRYRSLGGTNYKAPAGIFDQLSEYQPGKYRLVQTDGIRYFFDNAVHKRLTRLEDPNGNFINFSYTDSLLTALTNNAGQSISFSYTPEGLLSSVTDALVAPARTWTYHYDASGHLTQVTDPAGSTEKYNYIVNGPVKSVTDKNNNLVDIIYNPDFTTSELIGCNKRQSFAYDSSTTSTTVTDYLSSGQNQVTSYKYAVNNDIAWLKEMSSNCCGYNMHFEYDSLGNKIKETDANGNITQYTYDQKGNLLTEKDALNQVTEYTYTADFNKIAGIKDKKGFVTTFSYDTRGNLLQITEPGNTVYTATYNANGDILTSTNPKGSLFSYSYDSYGHPVSVTGPNGYRATLGFDARGNLLSFTDARNNTSLLEYDILSRLKKLTDPLNNFSQMNYDANGNLVQYKNENNESSSLKYDAADRPVEYTNAMGKKSFLTYDAKDNITRITDALGHSTTYSYDNRNRLTGLKDAEGNCVALGYDSKENLTVLTLPSGRALTYTYDQLDRVNKVEDGTGIIAELEYDRNNNITRYKDEGGITTQLEYDSLNRIRKITDPLGEQTIFTYDKTSKVAAVTDRNGHTKQYTYDSLSRIKTITDNNGGVTTITYDATGNVSTLTDANNNTTTYTYDSLNRIKRRTFDDNQYNEFSYDKKGNVTAYRLTSGSFINYTYDTLNRVTGKLLPDGSSFSYTYDAVGRVTSATNGAGTVLFAYDALNRLVSETFNSRTVRYAYSISGRTQTTIYPDSTVITRSFDLRNRLVSVSKNGTQLASYQYNNRDQVTSKTLQNGVTTNLQYDYAGRLNNISTGNGSVQNMNFVYDKNRNITAINRLDNPSKSEQFTYDNGNRLINYKRGVTGGPFTVNNSYTYDPLGNRSSANLNGSLVTNTHNNLNQLVSSSGTQNISYQYDQNGNLTYDGRSYKTYDAESRLLKDSLSPSLVITYQYDAMGRRIARSINGSVFRYTYAGLESIEERDALGNLQNRTVYNGFLSPVMNEKNGQSFYYHPNHLRSVEALTTAQGRTIERYEYDVYGKQTRYDSSGNLLAGSITGNRFGFTGQEYDSATQSNAFFFRNYNPETGLFNQRDLIGYADGMGMYQYVHDNPANGVDILGLQGCPPETYFGPTNAEGWTMLLANGGVSNITAITTFLADEASIMKMFGESGKALMKPGFLQNLLNSPAGSTLFAIGLTPFSLRASFTGARDLGTNWSTNSYGQNVDGVIGLGSGAVSSGTGVAVTGNFLIGASSSGLSGGLAAAGETLTGSFLVPLAGGLAIFGIVNEVTKGISGRSIAEHGETMRIPIFTSGVEWANSGYKYEGAPTVRSASGMAWQIDPRWMKIREEIEKGTYRNPRRNCPQNNPGGTQKPPPLRWNPITGRYEIINSNDPNEIIGPKGEPDKRWVSVNDRLPYLVTYENEKSATAPAKFVKITAPIHPKMDAAKFELGNFGFNNLSFAVPPSTASYYQRLDCRDSLGLFVDVTAGYDVISNKAFWEFQSIDPITLLPPTDPLKGFLLLQDSTKATAGHGFVNLSIKPVATAITLDTILAKADIIFDSNDTIPTNIEKNTIDAFAPTSTMSNLPSNSLNPVSLSWSAVDDPNGCGVRSYSLYVSNDGTNFSLIRSGITRTDTTFTGTPNTRYYFFVLATDSVGNTEQLRPGEIKSTFIGISLPLTWLYFRGNTVQKDNVLDWATMQEQNTKSFTVERSLNGSSFTPIGTIRAAGNSSGTSTYQYTDYRIDRLNSAVMFYRIKQTDLDNRFTYSNTIRLTYNEKEIPKSVVYPNPARTLVTVTIGDPKLKGTQALLYDEGGRLLQSVKINGSSQSFDLSAYLNGIYYIRLENKEVLRVVKQ